MNFRTVRIVRIFLSEKSGESERLIEALHDRWKIHGVTVYRGVSGYGSSGHIHSTRILDISYDLPITLEFYDTPERVDEVLRNLTHVKPGHVVTWIAEMWMD